MWLVSLWPPPLSDATYFMGGIIRKKEFGIMASVRKMEMSGGYCRSMKFVSAAAMGQVDMFVGSIGIGLIIGAKIRGSIENSGFLLWLRWRQ